jgi:hypothetical protein
MDQSLYERDFYTWTQDQAARLRARAGDNQLDTEHLAEEVADLGRSELNKVASNLVKCLVHLLEAAWLADAYPNLKWRGEAFGFAGDAVRAFTPGMRQRLEITKLWREALGQANARLADYGDPLLPSGAQCPFGLDDLLTDQLDTEAAVARVRATLDEVRPNRPQS